MIASRRIYIMSAKSLKGIGGILTIVSLFLPVVSLTTFLGTISISGYESDLVIVAILGGIVALSSLGNPSKMKAVISIILSIIGAFFLIYMLSNLSGVDTGGVGFTNIGLAIPAAGIGLILAIAGGIKENNDVKEPPEQVIAQDIG